MTLIVLLGSLYETSFSSSSYCISGADCWGVSGGTPGLIRPAGGSESSSALQVLLDSFRNEEGENEVNSFRVSPSPFRAPALGEADPTAKIVAPEVAQQLPASPANPASSWGRPTPIKTPINNRGRLKRRCRRRQHRRKFRTPIP